MDAKIVAVLALVLAALCLSDGECACGGGREAPGSRLGSGRPASRGAATPLRRRLPEANPVQTARLARRAPSGCGVESRAQLSAGHCGFALGRRARVPRARSQVLQDNWVSAPRARF